MTTEIFEMDEMEAFQAFNIDMGEAMEHIASDENREMTDEEKKLYGKSLWKVHSTKSQDSETNKRSLAIDEKQHRAKILASLVAQGMDIDQALAVMKKPEFVGWY